MTRIERLQVRTPQGVAGDLHHAARYAFNYTATHAAAEVSLGLPLRAESYAHGALLPIFAMNRPEGYLLDRIRARFAKVTRLDDMLLLRLTGQQQIGRLRYDDPQNPVDAAPAPWIGRTDLLREPATAPLFEALVEHYFQSGISGMQPKVLLPDADQVNMADRITVSTPTLIVKASGPDYPDLTQNEYLCMRAAWRAGIEVPNFWLSDDGGLFVMERFDLDVTGQPLGFEDMAVLMGRQAEDKYLGSYENIARMILRLCGEEGIHSTRRLFAYLALSVMVRNGDAHLKNFGLLYSHPADSHPPRLAPLYDVVTTSIYAVENPMTGVMQSDQTLALKLNGSRHYPGYQTMLRFGREVCLEPHPEQVIANILDAMHDTLAIDGERVSAELLHRLRQAWGFGGDSLRPRLYPSPAPGPRGP